MDPLVKVLDSPELLSMPMDDKTIHFIPNMFFILS